MVKFQINDLSVWFNGISSLHNTHLEIFENEILSIIGPAGSGKTTLLRTLNRLNELSSNYKIAGQVTLSGQDIHKMEVALLRQKVGMVFALPSPLPLSIAENVIYGVKMHGHVSRRAYPEIIERALQQAYLWEEVKDRLNTSAFRLSGGQQQRLCIARTLATEPEVILFDEPCSGLDPISTAKVEEALIELKKRYTIVLVTNNVKQAARVGDRTAFFLTGSLIEIGVTAKLFTAPIDKRTDDYISGKFG